MINWQTQQLRFTGFISGGEEPDPLIIWKSLTDSPPESFNQKPLEGVSILRGKYGEGSIELSINPSRMHIKLEKEINPIEGISSLGKFDDVHPEFLTIILNWLDSDKCPKLYRIAFGALLYFPVETRIDGYDQLSELLPSVKIDIENSSDFLYQINRSIQSDAIENGILINRLNKWSVQRLTRGSFRLSPTGESISVPHETTFSTRLELDINTSQDHIEEIVVSDLKSLMQALIVEGEKIASEGDK